EFGSLGGLGVLAIQFLRFCPHLYGQIGFGFLAAFCGSDPCFSTAAARALYFSASAFLFCASSAITRLFSVCEMLRWPGASTCSFTASARLRNRSASRYLSWARSMVPTLCRLVAVWKFFSPYFFWKRA